MRFVYAVINLLILAGLIYLVGRKSIVKIFRSRREKITRELDEAETPFAPEPLPEMPAPDDTALKSELAAAEKDGKAALAELDTQYEADAADQRREMLFTTRAQIIEQVLSLAEQHMRSAEYQASKLARQNEAVEQILAQIHLTPGDVSYISRKGVLYVTLTSAAVLPDETVEKVRKRAEALVAAGYKDITLLGQNVNSYGRGLDEDVDFAELLRKVNAIPGDFRIRFMTSHPKDATERLFAAMAECEKCAPHIHLPVQSGSDRILRAMNRGYTAEKYLAQVDLARKYIPNLVLTTDVIVGFPGETEEDFLDTLALTEKVRFDSMFTFIYSRRPGTPAAKIEDDTPRSVIQNRFDRLVESAGRVSAELHRAQEGKTFRVLIDGTAKNGDYTLSARTAGGRLVHLRGDESLIGSWANARIVSSNTFALFGEITE